MYHEDGIECYLKLEGEANENTKLAGFPLPESQNLPRDERNRRCLVLARHDKLSVVIRVSPHFNMCSASAVLMDVNLDLMPPRPYANRYVIQRSLAYEEHTADSISHGYLGNHKYRHLRRLTMRKASQALQCQLDGSGPRALRYKGTPQIGSIVIGVARGKTEWLDDTSRRSSHASSTLYGPGDPSLFRERELGASKPLASANGKWYFFEFCYRSEDCIRSRHQDYALKHGLDVDNEIDINKIALVEDKDYLPARQRDKEERKKASEAYKNRQADLATKSNSEETQASVSSPASSKQPSKSARSGKPQFCGCPDPTHNHSKKPKKDGQSSAVSRPVLGLPRIPRGKNVVRQDVSPSGEPGITANEDTEAIQAPLCVRCKRLKVPNYRRPAFLKKWYSDNGETGDDDEDDDDELPPKLPSDGDQNKHGGAGKVAIAQDGTEKQTEKAAAETESLEKTHDPTGNVQKAAPAADPELPAAESITAFTASETAAASASIQNETTAGP